MLALRRAVSIFRSSLNRTGTGWLRAAPSAVTLSMLLVVAAFALGACQQRVSPAAPPQQATPPVTPPVTATPTPTPIPAPVPTAQAPIVTGDGRVHVALLLPLSGQHAALGQSMQYAAELALFDSGNDQFALVVRDTETAGGAGMAAQQAIAEGAQLILGPLFANQVGQVAPIARQAGVSVISFSTDRSVAGPDVYVMGILPELQIERVVTYASSQGLQRYAALVPNSTYGRNVVQALNLATGGGAGTVSSVEYYDTGTTDLAPYVQRIAGASDSYDALLIPEAGDRLRLIAPLLPFYNIDPGTVRILGSTLWDDTRLGSEPGIAGAWFAAPPRESWQRFESRYRQLYGESPKRLASLAYDATALAAALARGAGPEAAAAGVFYDRAAITQIDGFAGIDGIFRFQQDGSVQRGLAVMELQYGGIVTKDAAPARFEDAIY
ncbi:MAG: penicillin-binding protein activator [Rhodospirillaceae bacterium]|nr:penicillin-binding protein activator [Rhodospirillaceae bacterium]